MMIILLFAKHVRRNHQIIGNTREIGKTIFKPMEEANQVVNTLSKFIYKEREIQMLERSFSKAFL